MNNMFEANLRLLKIGELEESQILEIQEAFFRLKTEYIDKNRRLVAQTFEALLEQIQETYADINKIPQLILDNVIRIFANIEHIPLYAVEEEKVDGSIILLRLLSFLKQHNSIQGDNDFSKLDDIRDFLNIIAEDLEQMRFIFDFKQDGNLMFPIDKLLVGVINDSHFLSQTKKIAQKDYYALKLAVRFFKRDSEGERIIAGIRKDCNLRFIDYLNQDSYLVDTKSMLNYQKNGVMVFWNSREKKILVRSNDDAYFKNAKINDTELQFTIEHEVTKDQQIPIGSFVEIGCDDTDVSVNLADLMKSVDKRVEVLKLFFNKGSNIFLPHAIRESADGTLHPMNPFSSSDKRIIINDKALLLDDIKGAFDEYSNLALAISRKNPCNRVSIGTFALLTTINAAPWAELLEAYEEEDFYQNQMICRWMEQTSGELAGDMLRSLYTELSYCERGTEGFRERLIQKQHFYPFRAAIKSYIALLDKRFGDKVDIVVGVVTNGKTGKSIINQEDEAVWKDEQIVDPEKILDMLESTKVYCIHCDDQVYVLEQNVLKAVYGLKQVFAKCMDFACTAKISLGQYELIKKSMELHKEALLEGAERAFPKGEAYFDDQVYYRLIHNMLAYSVGAAKVETYFDIIAAHDKISFEGIKDDNHFRLNEKGVLYVPKDMYSSDSVLSTVYNRYIKPKDVRDSSNLYDEQLVRKSDGYYRFNHKIQKIVFLFDNFESGTNTINCIAAYLETCLLDSSPIKEEQLRKAVEKTKLRIQKYYCSEDGEENIVSLYEILHQNNCVIEAHAYYGTEGAKQRIDAFLERNKIKHEPTSYMYPIQCTIGDISEKVKIIWPKCNVKEDKYAVIREFNMTKINVFPEEMLLDAGKAITLFIKKREKELAFQSDSNLILKQKMETVVDYLLSGGQANISGSLIDKLVALHEKSENEDYSFLDKIIQRKMLPRNRQQIFDLVTGIAIIAFVKYFKENQVDGSKKANTALYLISTLPPWIRIRVWEQVMEVDHSFFVLDKLVKAYAKNDQLELVDKRLQEWVEAGYVTKDEEHHLRAQAELLHTHRAKLSIAEDLKKAQDNYATALQVVDRDTGVDAHFIAVMDMLNSIG